MSIKCGNKDYTYVKKDGKIIIFNTIYESNTILLIIASFLEILIPEIKNFKIPLAMEIEDKNEDIEVDENLSIIGSKNFNYFIPTNHYDKWKKTYMVAYLIIILTGILMSILLAYILIISAFNLLVGIIFLIIMAMSMFIIIKFKKEVNLIKKYKKKDIKFNLSTK